MGFVLMVAAAPSVALTFYDVDFDADTLGQPPSLDTGPFPRTAPSKIRLLSQPYFGAPTVVASFGQLQDQPLAFRAEVFDDLHIPGDSVWFDLAPGQPRYRISFDVEVGSLSPTPFQDTFAVAVDGAPGIIRTINFRHGGDLRLFQSTLPPGEGSVDLGSFVFGEAMKFVIDANFALGRLQITVDGMQVFLGSLSGDDVRAVRFVLQDADGNGSATAAIDDVWITTPEPGVAELLTAVALGLTALRWRARGVPRSCSARGPEARRRAG